MRLRVYLTGRIAVEIDGQVIVDERGLRGKQGRLAFAYLVLARNRPVPREVLADLLWPGEMTPSWDVALSAVLSRMRRLLAAPPLTALRIELVSGSGQDQLLLPVDAWVDIEACSSALERAEAGLRQGALHDVLGPASVVINIARRPLLPDVESDWADAQRGALQRQLVRALECLAEMWLTQGAGSLAVENALDAIGLDPFRESSHRLLMRAYAASGNRADAVRAYQRLRDLLTAELGTGPAPETEDLYGTLVR